MTLLKNRGANLLVKTKVLESYVIHADPDSVPGYMRRNLLTDFGRIEGLIRDWVRTPNSNEPIESAENIFEVLPNLEFFEEIPLSSSDDFFFEGMVSAVRTSLLSLQAGVHAEKSKVLRDMTRELKTLKENYPGNFMQIKELELDLAN
jgi:hypothetical protein